MGKYFISIWKPADAVTNRTYAIGKGGFAAAAAL